GEWRLAGTDLDQGNEMQVPGNQHGNSEAAQGDAQAERHISRPINAPRKHWLVPSRAKSTCRYFQKTHSILVCTAIPKQVLQELDGRDEARASSRTGRATGSWQLAICN